MGFVDENDDGEIDCREAVRASAKIVLLIITTAWLFMGLGLMVVGIMAISNFGQYSGLVEAEVLYVVVIVGIVMMLVTIIGYCGIFKLKKILLIIYALSLFLLCIVMIIIGTSLLAYLSNVDASKSSFNSARESAKQNEERIQNFINCSYVKCCPSEVQNLTAIGKGDCLPTKLPTKKIEDGVCSSFKKEKLVSPTQCYNITIYNDGIVDHLKENLTPLMMFILVVAGVQLVAFCITMAFIMTEVRSGGGGIHSGQGEKHEI